MMNRHAAVTAGLMAALLVAGTMSLSLGPAPLSMVDIFQALMGQGDPRGVIIIQQIRLPRFLLAALVGASLGLAGAALQGLLRNPLAEPGVIGTSASAGFGAVVAFYFGWASLSPVALPVAAMSAAALSTAILLIVANRSDGLLTMILTGVAISSLAVALTALAINLAPNPYAVNEMVLWLLGSVKDRSLDDVWLALPFIAGGAGVLLRVGRGLDALSLGEETAASLGINVKRLRLWVVVGASLTVGASVAVAGSVGFVGLVVPHLLRPLLRHRPSALLLPSAVGGALLLVVADSAVRLIPSSAELMLGVITSLVGAPFFLFLVLKLRQWDA